MLRDGTGGARPPDHARGCGPLAAVPQPPVRRVHLLALLRPAARAERPRRPPVHSCRLPRPSRPRRDPRRRDRRHRPVRPHRRHERRGGLQHLRPLAGQGHRLGPARAPRRHRPGGRHHRFTAEVLPQNRKMLMVFKDAGYEVSSHIEDGVVGRVLRHPAHRAVQGGAALPRAPRRVPEHADHPLPGASRHRRVPAAGRTRSARSSCATSSTRASRASSTRSTGRQRRSRGCRPTPPSSTRRDPSTSPSSSCRAADASTSWRTAAGRGQVAARPLLRLRRGRGAGRSRCRIGCARRHGAPGCASSDRTASASSTTTPVVRLNATLALDHPRPWATRPVRPERRPRRRSTRLGGPARSRHLGLRVGRQPGRRLRERPHAVLDRRPGHRRPSASTSSRWATRASSPGSPVSSRRSSRSSSSSPASRSTPPHPGTGPATPACRRRLSTRCCARPGVIRVENVHQLFDVAQLTLHQPLPTGQPGRRRRQLRRARRADAPRPASAGASR